MSMQHMTPLKKISPFLLGHNSEIITKIFTMEEPLDFQCIRSYKIAQCKIKTLLIAFYFIFIFKCSLENPENREFNMDKLSE